jgi:hypothetical protein
MEFCFVSNAESFSSSWGPLAGDAACEANPYPQTTIPLMVVGRDCDLVPCPEQMQWFRTDAPAKMSNPNVVWKIVDSDGAPVQQCKTPCGIIAGTANHIKWPFTESVALLNHLRGSPCLDPAGCSSLPPAPGGGGNSAAAASVSFGVLVAMLLLAMLI